MGKDLYWYSITELRKMCSKAVLPDTGSKEELVCRLSKNDPKDYSRECISTVKHLLSQLLRIEKTFLSAKERNRQQAFQIRVPWETVLPPLEVTDKEIDEAYESALAVKSACNLSRFPALAEIKALKRWKHLKPEAAEHTVRDIRLDIMEMFGIKE